MKGYERAPMPAMSSPMMHRREYGALAGVDYLSTPSRVSARRSPDAKNVYKNYLSEAGQAIETRPGLHLLGSIVQSGESKIYGIHFLAGKALIHCGNKLYIHPAFGGEFNMENVTLAEGFVMNNQPSASFLYDGKLYLLDGKNYLVYDGQGLSAVVGTVPVTSTSAAPNGGGRVAYQGVNYLSDKRKNTFVSDGVSTVYHLDATGIGAVNAVTVNGAAKTDFTFDAAAGTVTFAVAPAAALTAGVDNVVIEFTKTVAGQAAHITGCTLCKVFDNRVFVSGNDGYRGVLFHSALDDVAYFSDEAWYDDGRDNVAIKAIVAAGDSLVCLKADSAPGSKVFFHTAALDDVYGKVYPVSESAITLGVRSAAANFRDEIVYLSPQGLQSVVAGESGAALKHKSTLVDRRLLSEAASEAAKIEVWNNYLCILLNGRLYLADSRQQESGEYEWYCWEGMGLVKDDIFHAACSMISRGEELLLGTESGDILLFGGTHDDKMVNGAVVPCLIESWWTTPMDIFDTLTHLKTTAKRGGAALVKRIPNSVLKIDVMTDKESWQNVYAGTTEGFSFDVFLRYLRQEGIEGISFGTGVRGTVLFEVKRKKIREFSMKFYSDEIDKPFGLYEAVIEYAIGNYTKK